MKEKKLYFFEYSGYGGECYVVRADFKDEAEAKLKVMLQLTPGLSEDAIRSSIAIGYLLEFANDIAKTQYLGE